MNYKHYKRLKALGFPLNNFSNSVMQTRLLVEDLQRNNNFSVKNLGRHPTTGKTMLEIHRPGGGIILRNIGIDPIHKTYELAKARRTMGEIEAHPMSLDEAIKDETLIGRGHVSPVSLLYVGGAVMRNPAVKEVLYSAGLIGMGAAAIGSIVYAIKKGMDYKKYVKLCIENNVKPLSGPEFNNALKVLKSNYKFNKLKLKMDYKNEQRTIRNYLYNNAQDIPDEEYKTIRNKYISNKADYKAAKKKLKEDYLNYRKSNYGHFYY